MRSDDAKDTRNDISADDILKLLHESVDNAPKKSDAAKKSKKLTLDDDVVEDAKPMKASSDDDIDIDALLEKFKPKKAPKAPEPEEEAIEFNAEPEFDGSDDTILGDDVIVEEALPDGELPEELLVEDDGAEFYDDDDVKVFGEPSGSDELVALDAVEEETAPIAALEPDEAELQTAVFDVRQVRESDDSNLPEVMSGATEVFTPVGADSSEPKEKTYGDPAAEDIDQTDLHLMIAFGMNDELKDTVGEEKASELEADLKKEQDEAVDNAKLRESQHYEYTSRSQNDEILSMYQSSYYGMLARIFLAVVLFGVMFVIENYTLLGITLPAFMKPESFPVVYAMVDLQLLVFGFGLILRHLIGGFKNLFTLKPTPESLTAFSAALSVVYTVASCIAAPKTGYTLFNLPIMIVIISALVYDFLNLKRDVFSFGIVSSKKKKFVVSQATDSIDTPEGDAFSEYLSDDSKVIRVGKTDFVDGFFSRVGRDATDTPAKPIIGILIPVLLIIAVGFFTLGYIREQSLFAAIKTAFIAVTVTMPISAYVIYSYPFYRASKQAFEADSAIIGEGSLAEYSGSAVISFEDKEVFPPKGVKVTSIKVYGTNRIDEIIYNLASAFITVGGPLAEVFSQATHDLGHSENVELEQVDEDGFIVTIDETQVAIGKASYMESLDFEPPYDSEDKQAEAASAVGIFYVAYQGELAAKVYVQYTIDAEFESILSQLYKTGMCVGIKSFDPNINDLLLAQKLKSVKYPIKVIRAKTVDDIPHLTERCQSGIVSKRSVKSLLKTVASCEKVGAAVKSAQVVKLLALVIGLAVMVFVSVADVGFELRSLWTVLYQLIFIAIAGLVSRLSV